MKKTFFRLASLLLVLATSFTTLISCDEINPSKKPDEETETHIHRFEDKWSSDNTHHWHSSNCEHQNEINGKEEHIWDDGTTITAATCANAGVVVYTCTVCEYQKVDVIPETGHLWTNDCDQECDNGCGTTRVTEHIDADADYKCDICGANVACDHAVAEKLPAKAATCTEAGLTEGSKCSTCGAILVAQEIISANGHTYGNLINKADATCTATGCEAYYRCAVCNTYLTSDKVETNYEDLVIAKIPHDYSNGFCQVCNAQDPSSQDPVETSKLEFELNEDEKGYTVVGIGTETATDIIIPATYKRLPVTSIDGYAFQYCSSITSITIGKEISNIGSYAFRGCTGLKSITVDPANTFYHSIGNCLIEVKSKTLILGCNSSIIPTDGCVSTIGNAAFEGCAGLLSITIPSSVISIGHWAFSDCTGLTTIHIPKNVTSIGDLVFNGCSGIKNIEVDYANSIYHSAGNCLIETQSKTLIAGFNNSVIPLDGSVTIIGDDAFRACTGLTSITIPTGVTIIGDSAFHECTGLTSVIIPDGVISIGSWVFDGCSNLKNVIIGNGITEIGTCAFRACINLESITIPESVIRIDDGAFITCRNLSDIYYKGTETKWNAINKDEGWDSYLTSYTVHYESQCGTPDPEPIPTYTVIFQDYDGTILKTQSVSEGESATAPSAPTREGYDFTGWSVTFNNITSDLTVIAQYSKIVSTNPTFEIATVNAAVGQSDVKVTIAVKNNPGIASIKLIVSYAEGLTLTNIEYNSAIGGMSQQPQTKDSPVILNWFNGAANSTGDWVFATLTFAVDANASGEYDITLTYDPNDVYNIAETNIDFDVIAGKIVVS